MSADATTLAVSSKDRTARPSRRVLWVQRGSVIFAAACVAIAIAGLLEKINPPAYYMILLVAGCAMVVAVHMMTDSEDPDQASEVSADINRPDSQDLT